MDCSAAAGALSRGAADDIEARLDAIMELEEVNRQLSCWLLPYFSRPETNAQRSRSRS